MTITNGNDFNLNENFQYENLNRPDIPDCLHNRIISDGKINEPELKSFTKNNEKHNQKFQTSIVWRNVIVMTILHLAALYGAYLSIFNARLKTIAWFTFIEMVGGLGVLAGSHRLWSHRSYKARWPLRLILMIAQTIALQNDIYEWVRDHRVHHKYSDTDADPHNARRGFFFSHIGWLLCRKHPEVKRKGSTIDMDDVWDDFFVRFQHRFYIPLVILLWGIFPVWIPCRYWNENLSVAIMTNALRYVLLLHQAWSVNSAAHMFGYRFYDQTIEPRENLLVVYLSLGEGYHNYHHVFPWDYSASEYGWNENFNLTTAFIDLCVWLGLAYDCKKVDRKLIENRLKRAGLLNNNTEIQSTNNNRKPYSYAFNIVSGIFVSTLPICIILILRYLLRN